MHPIRGIKFNSSHFSSAANEAAPAAGEDLLNYVRTSVVGSDEVILTPFGSRKVRELSSKKKRAEEFFSLSGPHYAAPLDRLKFPFFGSFALLTRYLDYQLTYCDYTASGRAVGFIEDYIREEVLFSRLVLCSTVLTLCPSLGASHLCEHAYDFLFHWPSNYAVPRRGQKSRGAVRPRLSDGLFAVGLLKSLAMFRSLNVRNDKDVFIFTGRGVTGAINLLVRAMRLWYVLFASSYMIEAGLFIFCFFL